MCSKPTARLPQLDPLTADACREADMVRPHELARLGTCCLPQLMGSAGTPLLAKQPVLLPRQLRRRPKSLPTCWWQAAQCSSALPRKRTARPLSVSAPVGRGWCSGMTPPPPLPPLPATFRHLCTPSPAAPSVLSHALTDSSTPRPRRYADGTKAGMTAEGVNAARAASGAKQLTLHEAENILGIEAGATWEEISKVGIGGGGAGGAMVERCSW